jgi:phospholipid/cholesterol/gamma-HCH transport system substrate-binding protein
VTRRSVTNIVIVSAFAVLCVAGLSFLAVGLGLEVPGKGGWTLSADFAAPEGLVTQADVAVSGVKVGRVVGIRDDGHGGTVVEMRINDDIRLRRDVQAIVRPKSQLGEKYVLLVRNRHSDAPAAAPGYVIPKQQTGSAVEIDDVLQKMDPQARAAFTTTLQQLGVALDGQGGNINESLPPLSETAANFRPLAQTAEARQQNIDHILTDLNTIMQALADEQDALGGIIDNGNTAFGAIAQRDQDLAGTIQQADALFASLDTTFSDLTPADRASLEKAPPTIRSGSTMLALTNPDLDRLLPELLLAQVNYPSNQLNVVSPEALALAYEWESAFAQRDAMGHSFRFTNVNETPSASPGPTGAGAASGPSAPSTSAPSPSSPGALPGPLQFLLGNGQ